MSSQVDLACSLCGEEFLVPVGIYRSPSHIVFCPCCGNTDLALLGVAERCEARVEGAAA
jgi:ribosomal protein S27E